MTIENLNDNIDKASTLFHLGTLAGATDAEPHKTRMGAWAEVSDLVNWEMAIWWEGYLTGIKLKRFAL